MTDLVLVDGTWSGTAANPVTYDAQELRRADAAMFGGNGTDAFGVRGGVVRHSDSSLAVSVDGSDVVTVQPGAVVIPGNAVSGSGVWRAAIGSSTTGSLTARDATNGRIDLVVFRQLDTDVVGSHTARTGKVEIIAGTPSATPAVPTLPSMAVELGRITVPASGGGAATVDSSNRTYAAALGGRLPVPSAAKLPASAALFSEAVALDTGYRHRWNGSAWVALDTDWTVLASSLTGWGIKYRRRGFMLTVLVDGGFTSADGTTYALSTANLPTALRPPTTARAGGYFGGYPGSVWVGTDGSVGAQQQSGASRGSVAATITYAID